jgi:hypothetical protein
MRIPMETIKSVAEEVTRSGDGNALFLVDMNDGETGVMCAGDIDGVLWGVSRGLKRIAMLSNVSVEELTEVLADMCKLGSSSEETVIRGEVIKGGN